MDPNLVVSSGDKESCVFTMNKIDCQNKIHEMINDSIHEGIYKETEDKTLDDLNNFKNFLYRSVKKYEYYEKMLPKLNQLGQLYETAKTHKLKKIEDITLESLNCHPVIAESDTCL